MDIVEIYNEWKWGATIKLICNGCGVCTLEYKNGTDWGYIYGLTVHQNYRKQGIATALMNRVEELVKKKGYHKIRLDVEKDRLFQYEWYKRLGYETWAEDDELYFMEKEI